MSSLESLLASAPLSIDRVIELGASIADGSVAIEGQRYVSPEKLLGRPVTAASDVFSLGAILFHALTGRAPFGGDSPVMVRLSICHDAPSDLRVLRPDVPGELATIVHRALSKEPEARYESATVVVEALRGAAARVLWAGKRILAADDDEPACALLARTAKRIGVEADVVQSGREVIDALKARRYDLALLDLNMPRLDGWSVLDYLRSHRDLKPRHLFVVTGFQDLGMSVADSTLVDAVLYKPMIPDELRALITACLGEDDVDVKSILRATRYRIVKPME